MMKNTQQPEIVDFLPVSPKSLGIDGLLFRCSICRCLLIDLDREPHLEAMHGNSAEVLVLTESRSNSVAA